MASFSPKPTKRYNVRSISMPTRSHPTTVRIEEELNKLKSWEATSTSSNCSKADSLCKGLSGLKDLYSCIEELLHLPLTQKALSLHQNEKWVEELLDGSVKYLDVCGNTRDIILTMKESVRELESAVRRRMVGDSSVQDSVVAYVSFRKKMKKEVVKVLATLKQMDHKNEVFPLDLDNHLAAVVRVLREGSLITSSIFQSLLLFLSTPVSKPRASRWSLVSVLVQKGVLACENSQHKTMNGMECVDIAISNLFVDNASEDVEPEKIESAQRKLEILDESIEGLEDGLDGLFRLLIHTRVSFLNILSH
ncbi:uncharacterized protein LOC126794567 [Argentina anserina]|uniref:uncharacterized protein LOC126794567 n=1 Tax=Argentina anserina TaxID=57926 RepID=UPI0021764115|nr:uncharacterized protein LOC126794567 [Potentilla anserina]